VRRTTGVIAAAIKDVVWGRLTGLALVNLLLAGVITGSAATAAIRYIIPLIPHATGWLGTLLNVGHFALSLLSVVLAVALSPAVSMFVGGMLFDFAAERVEKAIGAPAARKPSLFGGIATGFRIAIPALFLNVLALPLYLVPGLNAVTFYTLNGYLMGREYSMLAGLRRMPFRDALRLRRSVRGSVFAIGLVCSIIPVVAPLVAASAMTRLVNSLSNNDRATAS
jgi:uncharacterized protein involved in cysteine biosynthesis